MSTVESLRAVPMPKDGVQGVSEESSPPELPTALRRYRVTCVHHCSGCGRHFVSLEAFDLHRESRKWSCVDPNDVVGKTPRTRLVPKDTDGICALSGREVHGVTVWQTEAARNAGRRFTNG